MVGRAASNLPRPLRLHPLRYLGGFPGRPLPLGTLSFSFLLAGNLRRRRALVARNEAGLVALVASLLARALDPLGARWLPFHLLLLPRRLLQRILGRSPLLRGRGAKKAITGGKLLPSHSAKPPPLFSLPGAGFPGLPGAGCLGGDVVSRPGDRDAGLRDGSGDAGACCQRFAAGRLYLQLPYPATPGRRSPGRAHQGA